MNIKLYMKKLIHAGLFTFPFWALVFLVSPSLIVSSQENFENYGFALGSLAGICFAAVVFSSGLISLFPEKAYRFFLALFKSLFLVFFIVCVFFPADSAPIDGCTKDLSLRALDYIKIYGIYILGIGLCMFCFLSRNALSLLFSKFFIIIAILSVGLFCLNQYNYWSAFSPIEAKNRYNENTELSFGSESNIVVIMADMLQGSYVEQFLTQSPEEKEGFDGFTIYSRATSAYPFTGYGVPAILTGDLYANGPKADRFAVQARVTENSLIKDAEAAGYATDVISCDTVQIHKNQNSYISRYASPTQRVLMLIEFSLKRLTWISTHALSKVHPDNLMLGYKLESKRIMDRLAKESIGPSKKKLIYFHNLTPHAPAVFEANDLNKIDRELYNKTLNTENYYSEVKFFWGQIRDVLNNMKRLGVYDNSLVIIVADHGHGMSTIVDLNKDKLGSEDFNPHHMGPGDKVLGMYNPIILIKPPHADEALKISREAATNLGIRPAIQKILANADAKENDVLSAIEKKKQSIVIFKKGSSFASIYNTPEDHITYEFEGSIADLGYKLFKERLENAKPYTIGKVHAPANDYLLENWFKNETGAWLCNMPAQMAFKLGNFEESSSYILRLDIMALTTKKHPEHRVIISVNGKNAGEHVFSGFNNQFVDIPIPEKSLLSNKVNVIEFKPLDAISPTEAEAWKTETCLSILLNSFQILDTKDKEAIAQAKDYTMGTKIEPVKDYLKGTWEIGTIGAWLMDKPSRIVIKLNEVDGSKDTVLRLELQALISKLHPNQRVKIHVNGKKIGKYSIDKSKKHTLDIPIPSKYILSNDVNTIEFKPYDARSPSEEGLWASNNKVSILLYSFQLIQE